MPSLLHLSTRPDLQLQSESTQSTLQIQTMALARADALVNALALALVQAEALAAAARAAAVRAAATSWQASSWQQSWPEEEAAQAALARVQALVRAQVGAEAERQARALAHGEMEAHMVTYGEVLADSRLMDIIYSIQPEYRHGLARDLWRESEHYWWLIQIIVPITRLPQELLQQIVLIIIDNASHSPLVLMRVSKLWHDTINNNWALLKLGTTTPTDVYHEEIGEEPMAFGCSDRYRERLW